MASQKKKSRKNSSGRSSASGNRTTKKTGTAQGTRKSQAASRTGSRAKQKPAAAPAPQRESLGGEVVILIIAAVSVLLLLGNLNLAGSLGRSLRRFQLGTFGTLGYLFPVYLFWAGCFGYINMKRLPQSTALKLAASALTFVSVCGLLELLGGNSFGLSMKLSEYYRHGGESLGGGWFGGLFYVVLYPVIGVLGTYVVLVLVLIVGFVLTTGKSFVRPIREQGGRMMEDARAERELRREAEALRREEQALIREERRREMEIRRTELHARSLAFGEDTRLLEGPELPDAQPESTAEPVYEESVPRRGRRKITAEEMNAQERRSRSDRERERREALKPRRERRTLKELERLDREEPWQPEPAEEPAASPAFDPVIHMGNGETPEEIPAVEREEPEVRQPESPAPWTAAPEEGPRGDMLQPVIRPVPVREPEKLSETSPEEPAPAVPETEEAVHPAAEDVSIEDSMAGYDEFDGPLPTAEELKAAGGGSTPGKTGTGKKSEKKSLREREIWRTGDAPDGTAGVTLTSQAPEIKPEAPVIKKEYQYPPMNLLQRGTQGVGTTPEQLRATAAKLQQTLRDFGVGVTVTDISCGPAITRYELQPDQGVKVSRIVALQDDIKLNLAAADIRIEAPIPGKAAVGIEVPNVESQTVHLRDLLDTNEFRKSASRISFGVGKGISGDVVVADLARMPHLLIAGSTGSGKSVCINTIIMSILYKAHPDEVKLIMIDPKVVELSVYNGIPHLMIPVVTDVKKAAGALNWAVAEMTDRYNKFAEEGVRDIKGYNQKVKALEDPDQKPLPQIVVIVDEMADLMMVSKSEVEDAICRLAQLARAAGIHLVLATQRPSVDVITGLIKANVQSRIAFAVSSGVDSRTILDMVGAEKLLGKGDMLFYPSYYPKPVRTQGAFVSDEEVQAVVDFLSAQTDGPATNRALEQQMEASAKDAGTVGAGERDELFEKAGRFIIEKEKASIGNLQRMFRIGFNRAARIMDQLADYNVVGPDEGTKAREILMTLPEFEELIHKLYG